MTGKAQIKNNAMGRLKANTSRISTNFNKSRNININTTTIPVTHSNVTGNQQSDLLMNTFDIVDVDKIIFGTTLGSGSPLSSSDTGIGTFYTGTTPFGMKIQIPSTGGEIFQLRRGSNEIINISPIGTSITDNIFLGSNSTTSLTIHSKIGFYSATPIVKPTITGSKGGNAALTSLLSALSSFGLIINSTT